MFRAAKDRLVTYWREATWSIRKPVLDMRRIQAIIFIQLITRIHPSEILKLDVDRPVMDPPSLLFNFLNKFLDRQEFV